jgi:hypothetical protein
MYVRVVRFTDVSSERMQQMLARVKEAGGPPPGVRSAAMKFLYDEAQGTAISMQEFATAQDMDEAARVLGAMDPSETPGTRASVDSGEVMLEVSG